MNFVDFPYRFDERGRTAETTYEEHIRDLIEQILLTAPGERVHMPTFGAGLLRFVFEPNSTVAAAAMQASVHASLQQWLGELMQVVEVRVQAIDEVLEVIVTYLPRYETQAQVTVVRRAI